MWLLDANMDVHLVAVLADLGIQSDTAGSRMESAVERRSCRSGRGSRLNSRKHGFSFADAVASLEDEGALTMRDPYSGTVRGSQ
jgi:hypothetical protein